MTTHSPSDSATASAGTFARLGSIFGGVAAVAEASGPGWVPFPEHFPDDVVARLLAEQDAQLDGGPALAAQQLVGRLLGIPVLLLAMAVASERRLPLVEPSDVYVRWLETDGEPRLSHVAFTGGRMLVLADDPLAGSPGATVAPSLEALGDELVATTQRLSEDVVAVASRLARRGQRALWQTLADRIANAYLLVAKRTGDVDAARVEAESILLAAPKPLHSRIDWVRLEFAGEPHLFKRKSVCCLIYKAPAHRDAYCNTCPLLDRGETVSRLQAMLTRKAAG